MADVTPTDPAVGRASTSEEKSVAADGASHEEQPPLSDEAPPLPDEAPPLPDEAPPLPDEAPPLPDEAPPLPDDAPPDDGWSYEYDERTGGYYFYNRFTGLSQWENPRVPSQTEATGEQPPGMDYAVTAAPTEAPPSLYQGYNPKIHGDYDPNADYAKFHEPPGEAEASAAGSGEAESAYTQTATFNRFTGKFQTADRGAEYHNDENKTNRQMSAYFDTTQIANDHDGRSLKAERAKRKPTKKEVKEYNEKRKAKKEQKRREFLLS